MALKKETVSTSSHKLNSYITVDASDKNVYVNNVYYKFVILSKIWGKTKAAIKMITNSKTKKKWTPRKITNLVAAFK